MYCEISVNQYPSFGPQNKLTCFFKFYSCEIQRKRTSYIICDRDGEQELIACWFLGYPQRWQEEARPGARSFSQRPGEVAGILGPGASLLSPGLSITGNWGGTLGPAVDPGAWSPQPTAKPPG